MPDNQRSLCCANRGRGIQPRGIGRCRSGGARSLRVSHRSVRQLPEQKQAPVGRRRHWTGLRVSGPGRQPGNCWNRCGPARVSRLDGQRSRSLRGQRPTNGEGVADAQRAVRRRRHKHDFNPRTWPGLQVPPAECRRCTENVNRRKLRIRPNFHAGRRGTNTIGFIIFAETCHGRAVSPRRGFPGSRVFEATCSNPFGDAFQYRFRVTAPAPPHPHGGGGGGGGGRRR